MAKELTTPEGRALRRAKEYSSMLWHIGAFVIINAMLWFLDVIVGGDGLQWAYWVTVFWGIGLAFHVVAYFVDGSGLEEKKYQEFLAQERERENL